MPDKLLVNFVADFITKETVRCMTLKNEIEGPREYGLNEAQIATLNTFDLTTIFKAMREEVLALGIDLKKKKDEVQGLGGGVVPSQVEALVANVVNQSMYSAGRVHIRNVQSGIIKSGTETTLTILGNGFDKTPQIGFSKDSPTQNPSVLGTVIKSSCDLDLYQRLTVTVTLNESGTWKIQGRNSSNEQWNDQNDGVGSIEVKP